ncbi:MAG: 23S rRNA (guanosine(2251)-2'-O)-methyltransferase RlmB [Pseudomonadota bacterium]
MTREAETSLVYGRHACAAVLDQRPRSVKRLWVQAGLTLDLVERAAAAGITVASASQSALDARCDGGVHQGVCLAVVPRDPEGEDSLWHRLGAVEATPLVLVLDGVQDPRNLGACLRTAEAAGCLAVVTPRDKAAPLSAAARKASVGAAERMPLVRVGNLARTLDTLADHGVWRVGAAGEARVAHTEVDLAVPTALILGAEDRGLRRLTRQKCDHLVHIPMWGAAGSLNVSVAAGVLLFEAVRQRGHG